MAYIAVLVGGTMKTIMIYVGTATLMNAAAMTGDVFILMMAIAALVMCHHHTKTLTLRPMKKNYEKEM
jgi:membrane protein implicated in regulation of membrane protease activity